MLADQAHALRSLVEQQEQAQRRNASLLARDTIEGDQLPEGRRQHRARVLAITSGKGGVGKSNVAVNLAIQLAQMHRRVILLDADLGTANADVLCNLSPSTSLAHVVAGRRTLDRAIIEGPGGIRLIPGASGLSQMASLSETSRRSLIQQLRRLELEADLILIDTGAGVSPNVMSFVVSSDQQLVVTTPEPTAITDAYAVIKSLCAQRTDPDIRILVNMVHSANEAQQVYQRLDAVCRRFLKVSPQYAGYLRRDPRVPQAVRQRQPFVLAYPTCEAAQMIQQIAHRMDRMATAPESDSWLKRMTSWLVRA